MEHRSVCERSITAVQCCSRRKGYQLVATKTHVLPYRTLKIAPGIHDLKTKAEERAVVSDITLLLKIIIIDPLYFTFSVYIAY
jgi:hypothetical protein